LKIFIDTSAIIAYYNADDRFHRDASRIMKNLSEGKIPVTRLYTSEYVFDEATTFIKCVLRNPDLAERIGDALLSSPFTSVLRVEGETFEDAWERFKASEGTSFTDCTSFSLMERHDIGAAFTYDNHFTVYGFKTL